LKRFQAWPGAVEGVGSGASVRRRCAMARRTEPQKGVSAPRSATCGVILREESCDMTQQGEFQEIGHTGGDVTFRAAADRCHRWPAAVRDRWGDHPAIRRRFDCGSGRSRL